MRINRKIGKRDFRRWLALLICVSMLTQENLTALGAFADTEADKTTVTESWTAGDVSGATAGDTDVSGSDADDKTVSEGDGTEDANVSASDVSGSDADAENVSTGDVDVSASDVAPEIVTVPERTGGADSLTADYYVSGAGYAVDRAGLDGQPAISQDTKELYTAVYADLNYERNGGVFFAGHDIVRLYEGNESLRVYQDAARSLPAENADFADQEKSFVLDLNTFPVELSTGFRFTAAEGETVQYADLQHQLFLWEYEKKDDGSYRRIAIKEIATGDWLIDDTDFQVYGQGAETTALPGQVKLSGGMVSNADHPFLIVAKLYDARDNVADLQNEVTGSASAIWSYDEIYEALDLFETVCYDGETGNLYNQKNPDSAFAYYELARYEDEPYWVSNVGTFSPYGYVYHKNDETHTLTLYGSGVAAWSWNLITGGYRPVKDVSKLIYDTWEIPAEWEDPFTHAVYQIQLGAHCSVYPDTVVNLIVDEGVGFPADSSHLFEISIFKQIDSIEIMGDPGSVGNNITDMSYMFANYDEKGFLAKLDIAALDTSNVTDMSYMFSDIHIRTGGVDVSCFQTGKVKNFEGMFKGYNVRQSALYDPVTTLELGGFDTSHAVNMREMFRGSTLLAADLSGFDFSHVTDMCGMFRGNVWLEEVTFPENADTSNVTDMSFLFAGDIKLAKIYNLTAIDTQNVTNMAEMFGGDLHYRAIEVRDGEEQNYPGAFVFDIEKVLSTSAATAGYSDGPAVTSLDLSNFDTRKVKYTYGMFSLPQCTSLTFGEHTTFESVTDAGYMFDLKSLKSLDLTGRKFDSLQYAGNMFRLYSASELILGDASLNLSGIATEYGSFSVLDAPNVTVLDLSEVVFGQSRYALNTYSFVVKGNSMGVMSLQELYVPAGMPAFVRPVELPTSDFFDDTGNIYDRVYGGNDKALHLMRPVGDAVTEVELFDAYAVLDMDTDTPGDLTKEIFVRYSDRGEPYFRAITPAPICTWTVEQEGQVIQYREASVYNPGDQLVITAKGSGEANITATINIDGTIYTKKCRVTVIDSAGMYTAKAEASDGSSYYVKALSDGKYMLTGIDKLSGTTIDLTSLGDSYCISRIAPYAFDNFSGLGPYGSGKKLDDGLDATNPESRVYMLSHVTEVVIPASVEEIGYSAFNGMQNVRDIDFAENSQLKQICAYAFKNIGCNLSSDDVAGVSINIPVGVTDIGAYAFQSARVQSVVLPDSVDTIGAGLFNECTYLEQVTLPEGLSVFPERMFYDCQYLKKVTNLEIVAGRVTYIGAYAFYHTGIGDQSGGEFVYDAAADYVENPVALTASDCTRIGDSAICGCGLIKSFEGSKVTSMGRKSFYQAVNLETVELPLMTEIPEQSFYYCHKLKDAKIPSVITIGASAFAMNNIMRSAGNPAEYLLEFELPESVTYIGDSAFAGADAEFALPQGVTYIGENAFVSCYGISELVVPDSVFHIGTNAFANNKNLSSAEIRCELTQIPEGMFRGCISLEKVKLPDTVEKIGACAFAQSALRELILPAGLMTVGGGAFAGGAVRDIGKLEIPYGTTTIETSSSDTYAFSVERSGANNSEYTGLRELWLPSTLQDTAGLCVLGGSSGLLWRETKDGETKCCGALYYGSGKAQLEALLGSEAVENLENYHCEIHYNTGWAKEDGKLVFRYEGEPVKGGIQEIGGEWYRFDQNGRKTSDEALTEEGYVYYFDAYGRGDRIAYTADGVYQLSDSAVSVLVKGGTVAKGTLSAQKSDIESAGYENVTEELTTHDGADYLPYANGVLVKGYVADRDGNGFYFDDCTERDGRLLWYRDAKTGLYYGKAGASAALLTGIFPDETGVLKTFENGAIKDILVEDIDITSLPEIKNEGGFTGVFLYVNGNAGESASEHPGAGQLTVSVSDHITVKKTEWSIVSNTPRLSGRQVLGLGAQTAGERVEITALAAGIARVRVTVTDDTDHVAYAEISVKVTDLEIVPTQVKVQAAGNKKKLEIGESLQMSAQVLPENVAAKYQTVTWSVNWVPSYYSDVTYATIDQNGLLRAEALGYSSDNSDSYMVKVTAMTKTGVKGTYEVTIVRKGSGEEPGPGPDPEPADIAATGVVLNQTVAELYPGESLKLSATVSPANAADKSVSFAVDDASEDPAAVSVDESGKVTALHAGKAVVTVTANGNNKVQAQCVITVLESEVAETDENGNPIDPSEISTLLEEAKEDGKITGDQPVWVGGLKNTYYYTGNAIKPAIHVYKGHKLLSEKTDYTLSYKNNKNVSTGISDNKKKPQIVIKLKGSYSGSETVYFEIAPMPLDQLTADDLTVAYKAGKKNQLKPVLMYSGAETGWQDTKIKYSAKDITFTWADDEGNESTCTDAGRYDIMISAGASGNFTVDDGEEAVQISTLTVTELVPMSSVKLTGFKSSLPYLGKDADGEVQEVKQNVVLKYGNIKLKVAEEGDPDAADADCIVTYENNTKIGVATVIYTGTADADSVGSGSGSVATGFTGQLKKTFKITGKYTIEVSDVSFKYADENGDYKTSYTGLAIKPEVKVVVNGRTLKAGTDYTVTYKNNKAVAGKNETDTKGRSKAPQIIVKGKGNYQTAEKTGITKTFTITKCNLNDLVLTVADKAYNKKANAYKSTKITFADENYRDMKLKAGKDYTITAYEISGNTGSADAPAAGSVVKVTITGAGANFEGTVTGSYRIIDTKATPDISKAKVVINGGKACAYTGSAIEPHDEAWLKAEGITGGAGTSNPKLEVTMKVGKETITLHETIQGATGTDQTGQYEILGYYSNVDKGTAYILIRGINGYSGIRVVKFKIAASDVDSSWGGVYDSESGKLEK